MTSNYHTDTDDEDELWRRRPSRDEPPRAGATAAASEILGRLEALESLGQQPTAEAPGALPICRRCGKPGILHSLAGERVEVGPGLEVIGVVRTTCGLCVTRMTRREAGQS